MEHCWILQCTDTASLPVLTISEMSHLLTLVFYLYGTNGLKNAEPYEKEKVEPARTVDLQCADHGWHCLIVLLNHVK